MSRIVRGLAPLVVPTLVGTTAGPYAKNGGCRPTPEAGGLLRIKPTKQKGGGGEQEGN